MSENRAQQIVFNTFLIEPEKSITFKTAVLNLIRVLYRFARSFARFAQ